MGVPPIYLHFLDRELGESAGFILKPSTCYDIFTTVLAGTSSRMYVGLSLLWESPGVDIAVQDLFRELLATGWLDTVSSHASVDEFLGSRERLYAHDAERYPMYFESKEEGFELTQFKNIGTTTTLARELNAWTETPGDIEDPHADPDLVASLKAHVREALRTRDAEAITFPFFARFLKEQETGGMLRRLISTKYTQHYVQFGGGDIITGIPGLTFFDHLASNFPCADYPLLAKVQSLTGMKSWVARTSKQASSFASNLQSWRGCGEHLAFCELSALLLGVFFEATVKKHDALSLFAQRQGIDTFLRTWIPDREQVTATTPRSVFEQVAARLRIVVHGVGRSQELGPIIEKHTWLKRRLHADVLLMVATPIELERLLSVANGILGQGASYVHGSDVDYHDLGIIVDARVLVVQCQAGSVSVGGSLITAHRAITETECSAVILVGIAFGMNEKKQNIGDVLISQQISCYELQRVGTVPGSSETTSITRGDRASSSTRLVHRMESAAIGWSQARVAKGVMLSGEKLVDSIDYREHLRRLEPEAIGGEMEGAGLYAACRDKGVEWIVVKAICDWADGKKHVRKEARQVKAATNAATLVVRALTRGGFAKARLVGG